ncbi:UNVERIFIED_CONTAM: hypothetical protein FKN15_061666 [Acipenser sinensis]
MERVAMDVLGPFPHSEKGNRFILVALDYFTLWPEAYALLDQEAETVAEALLEGFLSRVGIPQELNSDQGCNFEAWVFAEMCRIQKTRTTPLHLQSDRLVERFNRTLAVTTANHQKDWATHLPLILLACCSAVQDITACTPALLMMGRELRNPTEMVFGCPPDAPSAALGPEYARRLQDQLVVAHRFARDQLQASGVWQKRNYYLRTRGHHFNA